MTINNVIINNSYIKCIAYNKEAISTALNKYEPAMSSRIFAGFKNNSYSAVLKKEVFFYDRDRKAWILINNTSFDIPSEIGRNDKCICGSNKKFKDCCLQTYDIAQKILNPFFKQNKYPFAEVNLSTDTVSFDATIEKPIQEVFK